MTAREHGRFEFLAVVVDGDDRIAIESPARTTPAATGATCERLLLLGASLVIGGGLLTVGSSPEAEFVSVPAGPGVRMTTMDAAIRTRPTAMRTAEWTGAAAEHARRVDGWTEEHRRRAATGEAHPVEDFLFTYYSHRPARLRRWHPGIGRVLLGPAARDRLGWRWYAEVDAVDESGSAVRGVGLDLAAYRTDRGDLVAFVGQLLAATQGRPAQLGCFGLHEWAMVYRQAPSAVRHNAWPLRLGPTGTDAVVERHQIRCTHFDAYRFFTPESLGRNTFQPSRDTQVHLEQPGCLHAMMDLYKWAYKLGPLVPGELLLACFELARDVRVLDMRASPYDLTALGYEPVPIETPDGKAQYVGAQRVFAQRASELRRRLLDLVRTDY